VICLWLSVFASSVWCVESSLRSSATGTVAAEVASVPAGSVASVTVGTESAATETTAVATETVPATGAVTIIDITQLKADPFTLKKDGFEEAGQKLGRKVDTLQERMSNHRAGWLKNEVIWGITWLKILLSVLLFSGLFFLELTLRKLIRRLKRKVDAEEPSLKELSRQSDVWIDPLLVALQPPLSLFIWGYGGLTIMAFLFSQVAKTDELYWIPQTAGQIAEMGGLIAFFWLLFRMITVLDVRLEKWADTTPSHWDNILVPFVGRILRFILPMMGVIFSLPFFHFSPETTASIQCLVTITLIGSIAWILFQLILVVEKGLLVPLGDTAREDLKSRKILTQVHILKKILFTIIGVVSLALMMMVFDSVRQLGTSILASAGVLGIIVGLAAQRTIGTLLAGIQIAMTQPIRIGDVVIVEGEWGNIEEISLTYVVVKIWDLRRLVVPINYFIEKPFQNWTRTSEKVLGTVYFYVDYTFPVDALREPLKKIVSTSEHWDKDVCGLIVTEAKERIMELRALVSAENSSKCWDLRCEVREKVIAWIQEHYPQSLPLTRVMLTQAETAE